MSTQPNPSVTPKKPKPRFALFIATAAGLGYLPKAPGTWGSLAGIFFYWLFTRPAATLTDFFSRLHIPITIPHYPMPARLILLAGVGIAAALVGVWSATTAANYSGQDDPQFVVIDEVSGQFLTYFLALAAANWKYLLLGFILFRLFDIWKPFPIRRAESLPGGWGIMADDWLAGVYAAICLWIALAAGL